MSVVCATCGSRNRDKAMFCSGCAGRLPGFMPSGPSALDAVKPGRAAPISPFDAPRSPFDAPYSRPHAGSLALLPAETPAFWLRLGLLALAMSVAFIGWYLYVTRDVAVPSSWPKLNTAAPATEAKAPPAEKAVAAVPHRLRRKPPRPRLQRALRRHPLHLSRPRRRPLQRPSLRSLHGQARKNPRPPRQLPIRASPRLRNALAPIRCQRRGKRTRLHGPAATRGLRSRRVPGRWSSLRARRRGRATIRVRRSLPVPDRCTARRARPRRAWTIQARRSCRVRARWPVRRARLHGRRMTRVRRSPSAPDRLSIRFARLAPGSAAPGGVAPHCFQVANAAILFAALFCAHSLANFISSTH